jgi:hypothetical protein
MKPGGLRTDEPDVDRELAVLERVEPDREGDDQPPVDVPDLRDQLEDVPVTELSQHSLVRADSLLAAAKDEVERQPRQQRGPVRPEFVRSRSGRA